MKAYEVDNHGTPNKVGHYACSHVRIAVDLNMPLHSM